MYKRAHELTKHYEMWPREKKNVELQNKNDTNEMKSNRIGPQQKKICIEMIYIYGVCCWHDSIRNKIINISVEYWS